MACRCRQEGAAILSADDFFAASRDEVDAAPELAVSRAGKSWETGPISGSCSREVASGCLLAGGVAGDSLGGMLEAARSGRLWGGNTHCVL